MSTEHLVAVVGQVLEALMGQGDDPRKQAEAHLQNLARQGPGEILLALAQIGALGVGGYQIDQRFLSLILLRRIAFRALPGLYLNQQAQYDSAPFDVIAERVRSRIETVICTGLKDEANVRMRKGLGDCAAGWAEQSAKRQRESPRDVVDAGPCLPLPPIMLQLVASREPFHRFTPFQLLNLCPTLLVDSVPEPIPAEQLAQLLAAGLNDPAVDVRIEAIKAVQKVVSDGFSLDDRNQVGPALALEAFTVPLDTMTHALIPLQELTLRYPKFVLPHLDKVLPFLLALLAPPSSRVPTDVRWSSFPLYYEDEYDDWVHWANLASEIIMALLETTANKVLAWDNERVIREMPGLMMGWIVARLADDGEECEEWLKADHDDPELEDFPDYPEDVLSRIAYAVADNDHVLQSLMQYAPALLRHGDYRCRYAALTGMAMVFETQLGHVSGDLRELLEMILPFSRDPHPRTRYAFLRCLGLFMAAKPSITEHSDQIMPAILHLLEDPQTRVKSEACVTVEFYFDTKPAVEQWSKHVNDLSMRLLAGLTKGAFALQEAVLYTLNCISADVIPVNKQFYRVFMGLVIVIIQKGTDPRQHALVARAANCAVALGKAAGKQAFSADAVKLAQFMLAAQNTIQDIDDPRSRAFMDAWCNFCRVMGEDFTPFLPHVMPPLLKAASFVPAPSPKSVQGLAALAEEPEDEYVTRTAEEDEKIIALDNLTRYAKALGGSFKPYISQVMEIALDGLSMRNGDTVREMAPKLVTAMLQCAKDAEDPSLINLDKIFTALTSALGDAEYYSEIAVVLQCLTDCLVIISMPLPPTLLASVMQSVNSILDDLAPQRENRVVQQQWMDEVQKAEELEVEGEEDKAMEKMKAALAKLVEIQEERAAVQSVLDRASAIAACSMG